MALHDIAPALLEDWLRHRYFSAQYDISSSGLAPGTLGDLRAELGIGTAELDEIAFRDSPSVGSDRLRAAVAARYAPGLADQVVCTHGASESLFLVLAALLRPGDEVVTLRPVYQSLSSIAEALGARLRTWELRAEDGFRPDLDLLRAVLTPRTRAIVVNFPHNPTGTTLTREQYEELLALVDRHGCHLLWDGSFAELAYEGEALPEPSGRLERALSFSTLSKAYGLPGLRVGWCVAPPALIPEMVRLRDYVTISTSPLSEHLGSAVLEQADKVLAPRRQLATANRRLLLDWAAEHPGLVELPAPLGGVTGFPGLAGIPDTTAFCHELEAQDGVLVVPGGAFGHPDRIRIGFGGPSAELTQGLDRLGARVERWGR
ncbi:capreomycidine synthase [Kitasatospora sp. MAA4]|uniref:capreomycidine synthase n=1 Tax=Kitasatospora sp. MAA4 TaxID=3035093 RepID=UPI00247569BE|nr:capreomycidine synthase [Kitasatospora sp. MAA4]MDH6136214.1 capreomycidine synthase [Kitasatospora sp. MAA4]